MKILMLILMTISWVPNSYSLTIVRNFTGGVPPTNSIGNGNLIDIFNAACDVWEMTFPNNNHVLTLNYEWAPVGGAYHVLTCQEGTPNRETAGVIYFNNDNTPGHETYYLSQAPLKFNEVSNTYTSDTIDLGVGPINAGRIYSWATTNYQHNDLFTIALHEIGHALGMSTANTTFTGSISNNGFVVTSGSYSNMHVPIQSNNNGIIGHIAYVSDKTIMSGSFGSGERVLPSALDIVALSELSKFKNPNINLLPILTIGQPYKSAGKTKIKLSWLQLLPVPKGKQYKVQSCTDLNLGNWTTLTNTISNTDGKRSSTITITGNVFFRLKLM
jgi:hypothetical protein